MNIGLIDADTTKGWPNLALMKLSAFHKAQGHYVDWFDLLPCGWDRVYASKVFKFSKMPDSPGSTLWGGTGISLLEHLDEEIEDTMPDYSIYPQCRKTIQYFSRGCIRKCGWCVVPDKEGQIRPVRPMLPNENGDHVEVLDNNFFANPEWEKAVEWLYDFGQPVSLHGVDVRVMQKEHAEALLCLNHNKQIHIAWDNAKVDMSPDLDRLIKYISPYRVMCYVLIGYDSSHEENAKRVLAIHDRKITPYVMCMNRADEYQKKFQKWVNGYAYKNVKWDDFDPNYTHYNSTEQHERK